MRTWLHELQLPDQIDIDMADHIDRLAEFSNDTDTGTWRHHAGPFTRSGHIVKGGDTAAIATKYGKAMNPEGPVCEKVIIPRYRHIPNKYTHAVGSPEKHS